MASEAIVLCKLGGKPMLLSKECYPKDAITHLFPELPETAVEKIGWHKAGTTTPGKQKGTEITGSRCLKFSEKCW